VRGGESIRRSLIVETCMCEGQSVFSEDQVEEEDLMLYETSAYDVVRCKIFFEE